MSSESTGSDHLAPLPLSLCRPSPGLAAGPPRAAAWHPAACHRTDPQPCAPPHWPGAGAAPHRLPPAPRRVRIPRPGGRRSARRRPRRRAAGPRLPAASLPAAALRLPPSAQTPRIPFYPLQRNISGPPDPTPLPSLGILSCTVALSLPAAASRPPQARRGVGRSRTPGARPRLPESADPTGRRRAPQAHLAAHWPHAADPDRAFGQACTKPLLMGALVPVQRAAPNSQPCCSEASQQR